VKVLAGVAHVFHVAKFALFALLRSNATWPSAVCLDTLLAGFVFCIGAALLLVSLLSGFYISLGHYVLRAQPRFGAASAALKVVPSVRMHLEHKNVYVQCVLLT
jgi:hypothetical protein